MRHLGRRSLADASCVAAVNAPQQITLSGDASALEEIAAALKEKEIFCRFLTMEYAFHSAHMDAIEAGVREALAGVKGSASKLPMISTAHRQAC